jgi:hypothetical protein
LGKKDGPSELKFGDTAVQILTFTNSKYHAGLFCPTIVDAGVLQNGMCAI